MSAPYRHCRHCGDFVPHDAPSAICGRCACRPVAERGQPREPGSDDDRKPTRCLHCGLVGSGETCPRCMELLSDIDEPKPEPVPSAPALGADAASSLPPASRRRASGASTSGSRARADLLRRCATFGPMARAQPR